VLEELLSAEVSSVVVVGNSFTITSFSSCSPVTATKQGGDTDLVWGTLAVFAGTLIGSEVEWCVSDRDSLHLLRLCRGPSFMGDAKLFPR